MKKPARSYQPAPQKIVSVQEAARIAKRLSKSGKKVVTTNGVFDLLHVGHMRALKFARSRGDVLMVGVNSDASVKKGKGVGRPIIPARERAEMLAALESVDYVFIFNTNTPVSWIKIMEPYTHVKSSDYVLADITERAAVEESGGTVVLFPHTGKHSTSGIIEKILALGQHSRKPESK